MIDLSQGEYDLSHGNIHECQLREIYTDSSTSWVVNRWAAKRMI